MNVQAKVDWIGTPKPYIYKDEVTYNATSIDFSLAGDDNRYKLIAPSLKTIHITKLCNME